VTFAVDFAPTWTRRYILWAKVSALFCAGTMLALAVVSGPGRLTNNEVATADAFGRAPPSSVPPTPIAAVSAPTIRSLGAPKKRMRGFAGRFAPARLTASTFRELNDVSHLRHAGAVIIDAEQIAMDRDIRTYPQLQRSLGPVWV
jgi:hypothetical protein